MANAEDDPMNVEGDPPQQQQQGNAHVIPQSIEEEESENNLEGYQR